MKRIAFKTFGCKANSVDTDALFHEARRRGFSIVREEDEADAYVINSCTVTGAADRDARYAATRYKRQSPGALVGVVGCYAQVARDELLALPEIDFCLGTADKIKILDYFARTWDGEKAARDQVDLARGFLPENFPGSRYARATVKVQDGCNFHCSFCIIPEARGRSRSLPIPVILKQIEEAYRQGFREITLTGIHLAHYGWDLNTDLMTLVRQILAHPEGPRIRLSTLDPFEIPDELIALLGVEKRLCPHFHIAIQSGSDKVLRGMRRIYKAREFWDVTAKIEKRCADTFIGIDVIVGFPGEGKEEFEETRRCLEQTFWAKLHVFPFSARKGTPAETMEKVRDFDIHERSAMLRALSDRRYQRFAQSQIGKAREVLLERPASIEGVWRGRTENYLPTLSPVTDGVSKATYRHIVDRVEGERIWTRELAR